MKLFPPKKERYALTTAGLMILSSGVLTLLLGSRLHYTNNWGSVVFAPVAFVVGTCTILAAIKGGRRRK